MEKTASRGASQFVLFTKHCWGDQIVMNEIGGVCSAHGRDKKTRSVKEKLKGRDNLEDQGATPKDNIQLHHKEGNRVGRHELGSAGLGHRPAAAVNTATELQVL
jgi:hypothetical protein